MWSSSSIAESVSLLEVDTHCGWRERYRSLLVEPVFWMATSIIVKITQFKIRVYESL